jgi:ribosome-binding protein aMBF1 (putative translation factor)
MSFASGKFASGICDICGHRVKYLEMRSQIVNEATTGLRVCPDCFDVDHPQLQVGKYLVTDSQALEFPRPKETVVPGTAWVPPWEL